MQGNTDQRFQKVIIVSFGYFLKDSVIDYVQHSALE